MTPEDSAAVKRHKQLYEQAELYYAYDLIHRSAHAPFRTIDPLTLFNVSRVLLMRTLNTPVPLGISVANIVYVLAKQAVAIGAFKLARFAYNKLQVRSPRRLQIGNHSFQVLSCHMVTPMSFLRTEVV